MQDKDITNLVDFQNNDDEHLPLTKCACGHEFPAWEFMISIYRDDASKCPFCNRKMYFRLSIRVFEVIDEE